MLSQSPSAPTPSGLGPTGLVISSPSFIQAGVIPQKYTCDGEGVNPELVIGHIPEGVMTMVLIMEDPDAPKGVFDHWLLWDILPANSIEENSQPGVSGVNSAGKMGYHPPCPPAGAHRYYFHFYALDSSLNLHPGATRADLEAAMEPHIVARGSLMARYQRVG